MDSVRLDWGRRVHIAAVLRDERLETEDEIETTSIDFWMVARTMRCCTTRLLDLVALMARSHVRGPWSEGPERSGPFAKPPFACLGGPPDRGGCLVCYHMQSTLAGRMDLAVDPTTSNTAGKGASRATTF